MKPYDPSETAIQYTARCEAEIARLERVLEHKLTMSEADTLQALARLDLLTTLQTNMLQFIKRGLIDDNHPVTVTHGDLVRWSDAIRTVEHELRRERYARGVPMDMDTAIKIAEAILRPYLTSAAIYGITPSHNFNSNIDCLPFRLMGDITEMIKREVNRKGE